MSVNSFDARRTLDVDGQSYQFYDITKVDGSDNLPSVSYTHLTLPTKA